ncbi:hypothetical protein LCGC14_3049720 [marine sediment metagenome]|uniref:HTH cro/C1-type domain-containing protein n=1 Tax=marine sediment metagenome TaxID=412755 RepID=A0A0F8YV35_9ZZZZ
MIRTPTSILIADRIKRSGLTQEEVARLLGVGRCSVNQLVNNKRRISTIMAIRLSDVFGKTPEWWLYRQADWDLLKAGR